MNRCKCGHTPEEHNEDGFCVASGCDCTGYAEDENSLVEEAGPHTAEDQGLKGLPSKKRKDRCQTKPKKSRAPS